MKIKAVFRLDEIKGWYGQVQYIIKQDDASI